MSDRKYVVGLATLAILIFSAIGVSTASAEQLAYECSSSAASKTFSDAHCLSAGGSNFGHVQLPNSATEITGTNEKTASGTTAAAPLKLRGTLSGVEVEVNCPGTHEVGSVMNTSGFLFWHSVTVVTWTKCTMAKPAGKGCAISGGTVESESLTSTDHEQAANNVKVSPTEGTKIADVKIEGCSVPALNNTFPLTGTYVLTASGATLTSTEAGVTTQNTLKFGGNKAGLEEATTVSTTGGNGVTHT